MYTKLSSNILTSPIWFECDQTRIVWVTMLVMKDRHGEVKASIPGLAGMARVSVKDCEAAIARFLLPDPYSRTKDCDGRMIQEIDGGWIVLNHEKYRDLDSEDDRKSKAAIRAKRYRDRRDASVTERDASVTRRDSSHQISHTDADTDTDAHADSLKSNARAPIASPEPEDENEYFKGFPKKKNPTPGDEARLTKDFGCRFPSETDVDFYAQKSGIPESFWKNWIREMEGFVVLRADMTEKRMLDAGGLPVMNWRTFLLALWTRQNNQKGSRQRAGFQSAPARRQLTREEELQEQLKECREAVTVPDALKDWDVEKEVPEIHWIRFKNCHQATITDRELYRRLYRAKQSRGEDTTQVLADLKYECQCEWGKDFERDWEIFMGRKV